MSNLSSVGKETLETVSLFLVDGAAKTPRCWIGRREDWEMSPRTTSDRICSQYQANHIPMYEAVFREVGFRLPFSPLHVGVFEWFEICPSQLDPSWFAYLKAFDLVCRFLRLPINIELFFIIFTIQRGLDKDGGCGLVSIRQRQVLFEAFTIGSLKLEFFLVRPRTKVALSNVLKVVERPHADVGAVSTRVPGFPFCWTKDHFKHT